MNMSTFTGITKALSDSHRVRALIALRRGELCACQIIELLKLAPSTVSKHLSVLKQAGLVESRKNSRWVHYRLAGNSKGGEETRRIIDFCASLLKPDMTTIEDDRTMAGIMKLGLETLCKRQKGWMVTEKLKILFLCTGNSCRSQMAEGWARQLKGDVIEPYSAGIETHGLNPNAVKVMAEAGVDISRQRPKHLNEVQKIPFDWVVTVCDSAKESCPVFHGKVKHYHVSFDDPPELAKDAKTEKEALILYRRVRDDIRKFIEMLPGVFDENSGTAYVDGYIQHTDF